MSDPTVTRTTSTLLAALHDPANDEVWSEFDHRYRPILQAVAGRMGLDEADAEEAAQETMVQFVRDYRRGRYDRSKGRLRFWIHGILRNRILDLLRKKQNLRGTRGESVLGLLEDEDELKKLWDAECRQKILADALVILQETTDVQPSTVEAFRLYALEERPPKEVAERLGINVRSVYLAKHRCAKGLKEIVEQLTSAYDHE